LREVARRLAQHDYMVEERAVVALSVTLPGTSKPVTGWALNEVIIEKAQRRRMIDVGINVDGRPLEGFGCDGIIVATPTGSTAHAFAAGGPVLWPDVAGVLLVPLAAHALFARPIVISPTSVLQITILQNSPVPAVLTCDGRRSVDLPLGSVIEMRLGDDPLQFARLTSAPFTDRIVEKFALPVVGWRKTRSAMGGDSAR
jgi:NAD+ kinase